MNALSQDSGDAPETAGPEAVRKGESPPATPLKKNRYCGSKHPHPPHEQPMIGHPEGPVYVCKGKETRP
jgi:hypothetical protein